MARIFISYASEDRAWAADVANTLTACGFEVWWDRDLVVGDKFSDVIAGELEKAACVVVLWSEHSVTSRWVVDEANVAVDRGVYLPVSTDGTKPPLGLRSSHYSNLADWDRSHDDPAFQQLVAGVRRHTGGPHVDPIPVEGWWPNVLAPLAAVLRRPIVLVGLSALPAVAFGAAVVWLSESSAPADITVRLNVSLATLSFRDSIEGGVLASSPTMALAVGGFETADLAITKRAEAQGVQPARTQLVAVEPPASVTFYDVQCEGLQMPGPSRATFGWRDGGLTLHAPDASLSLSIAPRQQLRLACDRCAVDTNQQRVPLAGTTDHAFSYESPQIVTIRSNGPETSLSLDAPAGSVLLEGNFVVTALDFTRLDDQGRSRISSISSGAIEYRTVRRAPRDVMRDEFLVLESLSDFYVTRMVVTSGGLQLDMHGRAGALRIGRARAIESQLPTQLDVITSQSPWVLYGGTALAVSGLALGVAAARRRSRGR